MAYSVVFAPEAERQLIELYRFIAQAASPNTAQRYTNAIITYCEGLATFPNRSVNRDDIRQGILITNYKKRTVIAYTVVDQLVTILGIFYGGQDFESILQPD